MRRIGASLKHQILIISFLICQSNKMSFQLIAKGKSIFLGQGELKRDRAAREGLIVTKGRKQVGLEGGFLFGQMKFFAQAVAV